MTHFYFIKNAKKNQILAYVMSNTERQKIWIWMEFYIGHAILNLIEALQYVNIRIYILLNMAFLRHRFEYFLWVCKCKSLQTQTSIKIVAQNFQLLIIKIFRFLFRNSILYVHNKIFRFYIFQIKEIMNNKMFSFL